MLSSDDDLLISHEDLMLQFETWQVHVCIVWDWVGIGIVHFGKRRGRGQKLGGAARAHLIENVRTKEK